MFQNKINGLRRPDLSLFRGMVKPPMRTEHGVHFPIPVLLATRPLAAARLSTHLGSSGLWLQQNRENIEHQPLTSSITHSYMMTLELQLTWDLRALVVCTCVLYLKFLITTMVQGRKGFAAGTRAPEDKALPMAKLMPTDSCFSFHGSPMPMAEETVMDRHGEAAEDEARWKRIIQNDLESIPLALVVFLVATYSGSDHDVNAVLTAVYTAARISHTVAYANKRPVLRMLTWITGVVSVVTTAVLAVIAIF